MRVIENDPSFKIKSDRMFGRKPLIGTSVFFYVPSYQMPVERVIVGFKYFENMNGCTWKKFGNDSFRDKSLPNDSAWDVFEGSLILKLVSPHNSRTRMTMMHALDIQGWDIMAYSASWNRGVANGDSYLYSSAKEAIRDLRGRESLHAITPAWDGVPDPQRKLIAC